MAGRIFTRCLAIVYLILGVCAFVPQLNGGPSPNAPVERHVLLHFEELFWQMPMNYLLAPILIGFGIAGILCSLRTRASVWFERIIWTTSLFAMILGLCPHPLSSVFGLIPLFGWTDGLWLITFLITFYFAFFDGPMPAAATEPVFRQ